MNKKAFTLAEILIVVAIIAIMSTLGIILLNPVTLIQRSRDTKQKTDLSTLKKVMEDWYNDKNCYPKPSEICYDSVVGQLTCHICGRESASPPFTPYLSVLPCTSNHPASDFFYKVDVSSCPQSYRIYTNLENKNDEDSSRVGCVGGSCGPAPVYGYNFGVTSPNVYLERSFAYYLDGNLCNSCGGYEPCAAPDLSYISLVACCDANPGGCTQYYCIMSNACMPCGWSSSDCYVNPQCEADTTRTNFLTCCDIREGLSNCE